MERWLVFLLFLLSPLARASEPERIVLGRLPCADGQSPRDHGVRQWAWEAMKRTSLQVDLEPVTADPAGPDLFRTPFLFWSCRGAVAPLGEEAVANLRRFLVMGGFLLADDPSAGDDPVFMDSLRQTLRRVLPGREVEPVPPGHVLFRSFFLARGTFGRRAGSELGGIVLSGRLAVVVSGQDLLGAVARDHFGNFEHICEPEGEDQRERSFRLLINVLEYALCLDYKDDRVHLPFILRRRKVMP
ncbi:MAG: DUF4159 domain-containing protein [Myxococcales bacterium]|nr:DUF4159 domain-containing protein [Myxococcales bacterium]